MTYSEFKTLIVSEVAKRVDSACTVSLHEVVKNNHTLLDGLLITNPLINISPTIYLNPYFHRYLNGVPISDIVDDIERVYESSAPAASINTDFFTNYQNIRSKIVMKLVSYEKNIAMLSDVPYRNYLDLAVIFQVMVESPYTGNGTITIHNDHLDLWGITEEELYRDALANTPRLLPYEFMDIFNCIRELYSESFPDAESFPDTAGFPGAAGSSYTSVSSDTAASPAAPGIGIVDRSGCHTDQESPASDESSMYVLTNQNRTNGASVILYPHMLEQIAARFKSNLILLPSSIHEFIIVPTYTSDFSDDLEPYNQMVEAINETELADEEVLSEHAYYYCRRDGQIYARL